ncbi:cysteine desulfurase DndA [Haloechinothrix halophila]|uniref:cysteine desulfurase DndA n=1 Tax=Haloechinothrix halophila TaxID=1069073 RepID=UPI0004163082|nr:cysteine desulfurase DndA [Haloechinothrix halophila]
MTAPTQSTRLTADRQPSGTRRAVYLDCNATAPLDERVLTEVHHYFAQEFGNAGSRTHDYGQQAKDRVIRAREQVASIVASTPDEIVFTSGATESNNLALLGLAPHGEKINRRHIISTQIEHKAVLEPLETLSERGFDVTLVPPTQGGWVDPDAIQAALRPDTLAVSIMQVNNETGIRQPIEEIAAILADHDAYLHVDAAQGFGKDIAPLQSPRIDLASISGHKIYGPKGIGALLTRRRGYKRPPLTPLLYGGGQERGLRPGTLPVALIAGLGTAAQLANDENTDRAEACTLFKRDVLATLESLNATIHGDADRTVPHAINVSIPDLDSEAVMLALKGLLAISNGSACTSQRYEPSHVLKAMQLPDEQIQGALRLSWSHLTPPVDWDEVRSRIHAIR